MSDTGRQSMTDNIKGAVKPDSQKSMTEQAAEKVDSMVGGAMPNSLKSNSQMAGDNITGKDDSMLNKAKNAVGMGSNNNSGSSNNN